jgi:hypothetical protein
MDIITHNVSSVLLILYANADQLLKWVDTQDYPFPDFGINKKCVDHKQLLNWQSSNELSENEWAQMAQRGPATGEHVIPMQEQFQKWAQGENAAIPH